MTSVRPGDFERVIADIECEARDEGPRAVRELAQLRAEFRLARETIASRHGEQFGEQIERN